MAHTHVSKATVSRQSHRDHQRRLTITLALTATVLLAEIVGAVLTQSLALLVDAGHMLTDVSVLAASTITAILVQRKPSETRTWGWARLEVLTAAAGALVLLFVGVYACVEAAMRLAGHGGSEVQDTALLLGFGLLGLFANLGSLVTLVSQKDSNMNMRAAFLEVCNDALGSVAVVLSAVVMLATGWQGFDALAGGVIALMMIPRAVLLLRKAVRVLLEETPEGLDLEAVRKHMEGVPHVVAVHDLHASTVATGLPRLTAHVVVDSQLTMREAADVLSSLQHCLQQHFPVSIEHTTFQLEPEGYQTQAAEPQSHE